METLIIDCDGVLYPESQLPIYVLIKAVEKQAYAQNISKEEYKKNQKKQRKKVNKGYLISF